MLYSPSIGERIKAADLVKMVNRTVPVNSVPQIIGDSNRLKMLEIVTVTGFDFINVFSSH